jgi:hypothetical protein
MTTMFGKKSAPFPAHEFADRLDALITAGRNAGMSASEISRELEKRMAPLSVRDLEQRLESARLHAAVNVNLGTVPVTYDGYGKRISR